MVDDRQVRESLLERSGDLGATTSSSPPVPWALYPKRWLPDPKAGTFGLLHPIQVGRSITAFQALAVHKGMTLLHQLQLSVAANTGEFLSDSSAKLILLLVSRLVLTSSDQPTVLHRQGSIRDIENSVVVGDQQDGAALLPGQPLHQGDDIPAGAAVEGRCWLVR